METFALGPSDVETYAAWEGLGLERAEQALSWDTALGVGLTPSLSVMAGMVLFGDGALRPGGVLGYGMFFGTPVNTAHFDVDLMLTVEGMAGYFGVSPGMELNLDAADDLSSVGTYVRVAYFAGKEGTAVLSGGSTAPAGAPLHHVYEFDKHLDLLWGAYWSVTARMQLLIEADAQVGDGFSMGGVALGLNTMVTDSLELITQVYGDIPQDGESFAVAVSLGCIATFDGIAGGASAD